MSRDTWEGDANLPMSYNRWLYTYGNPVNYTDPSGLTSSYSNNTLNCLLPENDEICHWFGRIPDNEGIAIVNENRNAFTEDNINNPNLSPTHIAASIAVQSQWMNDWWQQQQEGAYKYYLSIFGCDYEKIAKLIGNPGLGYGGIAIYDKENGIDIPHFGDPNIMENSIAAITRRIEVKSGECLYKYCSKLDKLIVIAMAQNTGYTYPDGKNFKNITNPWFKIDWTGYFGDKENPQNTSLSDIRTQDIGNINFNTQFQVKLYIQNLRELINKYDWPRPDGVTDSEIQEIYLLVSKNYQ